MTITTATIEIETTQLTKAIVKQLDYFRFTSDMTTENLKNLVKPVGRISTPDGPMVIMEVLTAPGRTEVQLLNQSDWFNQPAWVPAFGALGKLPKIVLLK